MARRKTLRKHYAKNKQKNYSKKVGRRINARKRKRAAAGLPWFSRRALIHPAAHAAPAAPPVAPAAPAPAPAYPGISPVSAAIFENSVLIKLIATELETMYNNSPEIFTYMAEAFGEFQESDPFPQRYSIRNFHGSDIYNPYLTIYITRIQPYIQNLPDTEHFDENSALRTMDLIHSGSLIFRDTIINRMGLIQGFLISENKLHLEKFIRLLNNLMVYSHPDQYILYEY